MIRFHIVYFNFIFTQKSLHLVVMKTKNILWTLLIVAIATTINIFSFLNFSNLQTHLSSGNGISKSICISSFASGGNFAVEVIDFSISLGNHFRGHYKNYSYSHHQIFSFNNTLKIFFIVDLPGWESHTSTLPIYLLTRHLII